MARYRSKMALLISGLALLTGLVAAETSFAQSADGELQVSNELAREARVDYAMGVMDAFVRQRSGHSGDSGDSVIPDSVPLGTFVPFWGPKVETLDVIENGAKVTKYWEQLTPAQWKSALSNQFTETQVYDARSGGTLSFLPIFNGELQKGDYKVLYHNVRFRDYPCDPRNPNAGVLLVGVGLKIDVNARTRSAGVNIGFGKLALGANSKKVTGVITAELAGLANSNTLSQVVGALGSKELTFDSLIDAGNAYAIANQALENMVDVTSPRIIGYKDLTAEGACLTALRNGLAPADSRSAESSDGPTEESRRQRIIGGELVDDIAQMPWMVSLYLVNKRSHWCGASIIDPQWLLTAAHCVEFTSPAKWIGYADSLDWTQPQTQLIFDNIVVHPNYNPYTSDNDVALIHISNAHAAGDPSIAADLSDNVIGLMPKELSPRYARGNTIGLVAGWGATSSGGSGTTELRQVAVQIRSNSRCNAPQSYNGAITDNMLCAGFAPGGRDSCQGDSGGPFTVNGPDHKLIAGVVSWGEGCAEPEKFGVYARVENYVEWIADTIGQN